MGPNRRPKGLWKLEEVDLNIEESHEESDSGGNMASGKEPNRGLIKNIYKMCNKKVTGGPSRSVHTQGISYTQPATHSQPATHTQLATHTQSTAHNPHLPSLDATHSTLFYPYYPPPPYGGPPAYPYPLYISPYYPPPPLSLLQVDLRTAAVAEQTTDGRMLIAPDGDMYKEMLGREPTPVELHSHTHKWHEDQQWIDERARKAHEYTRLRESQAAVGESPSGGSVEYSEYHIWSQAVGGMQYGRVYGLGSQAQAYEGMTSSGSSFASPPQDSSYSQQITALQAELE
ncbi:hypothetical protein M5K25_020897 [Dendrobium thyrsiflorum]|uniref:Uncharacterized protein n=1 Tax=Dendrobium thyrsiflorum TaxID=117978 RepID=A0ABD0UB22_DENTH